jgi:hypothetical protein
MNLRKTLVAAGLGVSLATAGLLAPAHALGTVTTFQLGGGALSVSEPAPVNLGLVAPGSLVVQGNLGTVTVNDTRGALVAAWTSSVTSTEFLNTTTGGTTANEKVALANIAYTSGAGTNGAGTVGAFVPGVVASMALPAAVRLAGTFAGVGSNSVSWDPTLVVTLLPSQVAGTYQGTVTHSVA